MKNKNKDNRIGKPYFIDKFSTIKASTKIGFLKFWVAGVSYFLAFMTTESALRSDIYDQLFIMFLLIGLLTEYVTNKIIYHMDRPDQLTLQYLPFKANKDRKKLVSLLLSLLYAAIMIGEALILHTIVVEVFQFIGIPTLGEILLGVKSGMDPISFGLYILLLDMIWYKGRKVIIKEK
ncbi:hypothetical protein [Acholeplasma granularum]|uniref:hypothetical protein n=1 Tax=Acholeplasma granularum TaxID=264635 RepID=UPI00046FE01C|nr:hypothetical protein [Acholeplasma granularum]